MFNKILNAANNLFGKNQTLTLSLKTICSRLKIFVTMTNKRGAETRRDWDILIYFVSSKCDQSSIMLLHLIWFCQIWVVTVAIDWMFIVGYRANIYKNFGCHSILKGWGRALKHASTEIGGVQPGKKYLHLYSNLSNKHNSMAFCHETRSRGWLDNDTNACC